jgi:hypothetical protein
MKPNKVTCRRRSEDHRFEEFAGDADFDGNREAEAGLRELLWYPNADERQYYISSKGRMAVLAAGTRARTMDVQEMFDTGHYEDISLAEWTAHTPHQLIDQRPHVGTAIIDAIRPS